jgi:uncharacterized membrane protein YeiB
MRNYSRLATVGDSRNATRGFEPLGKVACSCYKLQAASFCFLYRAGHLFGLFGDFGNFFNDIFGLIRIYA